MAEVLLLRGQRGYHEGAGAICCLHDRPRCSSVLCSVHPPPAHSEGVMGGLVKEEMEKDFGAGCSRDEGLQLLVEE